MCIRDSSKSLRTLIEINEEAIKFSNLFDIKIEKESKQLPSMYWIPKMNEKPVGARFIIASKKCTTKPSLKLFQIFSKLFTNMWKVFLNKPVSFLENTNFESFKTPSLL